MEFFSVFKSQEYNKEMIKIDGRPCRQIRGALYDAHKHAPGAAEFPNWEGVIRRFEDMASVDVTCFIGCLRLLRRFRGYSYLDF